MNTYELSADREVLTNMVRVHLKSGHEAMSEYAAKRIGGSPAHWARWGARLDSLTTRACTLAGCE